MLSIDMENLQWYKLISTYSNELDHLYFSRVSMDFNLCLTYENVYKIKNGKEYDIPHNFAI